MNVGGLENQSHLCHPQPERGARDSPGCTGVAKCHPTAVTQPHREDGMETPPTPTPPAWGRLEQQHPQTEGCGKMMRGPQSSLRCTDRPFPVLPWYQHPPWPPLVLLPSSPPSLCAVSLPHATRSCPPKHTQGPGTAAYISKTSFLEGRKRGDSVSGTECASWDSPASPSGTGSAPGAYKDMVGCRVLWSLHLDTEHGLLQPP